MRGKICQQSNGRYYIRICYKGNDFKFYRNSRGERLYHVNQADALLGTVRTEIDEHRFNPDKYLDSKSIYNFKEVYEKWVAMHSGDYVGTITSFGKHFSPLYKKDIRGLIGIDIINVHETIKDYNSASTIMGILRAFLRWAWKNYRVLNTFPEWPEKIKPIRERKGWLSREQQEKVLECVDPFYVPIMKFCMYHGVRPSEARKLLWRDVDLEREEVLIRHEKTDTETTLPLHPDMVEILTAADKSLGYVFPNKKKGQMSRPTLQNAWTVAAKEAGFSHICMYEGTRHSLASQAASDGASLLLIGKVLGHTRAQTTLRYTKVSTEAMRSIIFPIRTKEGQGRKTGKASA